MKSSTVPLILGLLLARHAFAETPLENAATVIQSLTQAQAEARESSEKTPQSDFTKELDKFTAESTQLPPEESASQWIGLVKKWIDGAGGAESFSGSEDSGFSLLVKSVPPPTSWEHIQKIADGKPLGDPLLDSILALFSATLRNDQNGKWKAFQALREEVQRSPDAKTESAILRQIRSTMRGAELNEWSANLLNELAVPLAKLSDDPAHILDALNVQLESFASRQSSSNPTINVPNLVAIVGSTPASKFLERAMVRGVGLQIEGIQTLALAQSLALKSLPKLKAPQWGLVRGISETDTKLYEAMAKKFSPPTVDESDGSTAEGYYLLSLIASGRTDEARKLVLKNSGIEESSLPSAGIAALRAAGYGPKLYAFLHGLLEENPDLPLWSDYLELATDNQKTSEAIDLAKTSSERKNLTPGQLEPVLARLEAAYLARGSVEEARTVTRERAKLIASKKKPEDTEAFNLAVRTAELGQILKRDDIRDEGISQALAFLSEWKNSHVSSNNLVSLLVELKRYDEARQVVATLMKSSLIASSRNGYFSGDLPDLLTDLAGIYDAAGLSADVLILLTDAPWWGMENLSEIVGKRDFRGLPLGVIAAKALYAQGKSEKAVAVLESTIRLAPSSDAAYALLAEIQGSKAIPFLENEFSRDRFEERPLIWKAYLLLRDSKLVDAEATIRQAIAIDPSDGEMGRGDRMRAYDILGDILDTAGKLDDAKIYRGAVKAVRLSEEADRFKEAGLLTTAVAMYQEALTYFADAYCIQSRLAIQLATLGDMAKAEEHYRRAYELMPDSFGRMESHCFGCERAFKGQVAETLAEKTFKSLLAANPQKPQLHYLLGYLRMEQERYPEALKHFQDAVKLDPDYLNAWNKIYGLGSLISIPIPQRDEANLAVLRLDPSQKHGEAHLDSVSDLTGLWNTIEDLRKQFPKLETPPLLPLESSARALESNQDARRNRAYYRRSSNSGLGLQPPGEILARHDLIRHTSQTLAQLIQASQQSR